VGGLRAGVQRAVQHLSGVNVPGGGGRGRVGCGCVGPTALLFIRQPTHPRGVSQPPGPRSGRGRLQRTSRGSRTLSMSAARAAQASRISIEQAMRGRSNTTSGS
jgi:hypothetical protein